MKLRVQNISFAATDCHTRLPFRFGMNTMTWAPTLTARVEIESDAGSAVGYSADLLVPKWFEKDPAKSLQQDIEGLMESARLAAQVATGAQPESVFDLWWRTYRSRVHSLPSEAPQRLLCGFGVALVERAVMDAACRAAGISFFEALKSDLFGFRPGAVLPELDGWSLAEALDAQPLESLELRHTIGLLDPLRDSDIAEDQRISDGLPESFEEDVRTYGLSWFKLKLCGDAQVDLPRTLAFGEVLAEHAPAGARFTVDGNEQYADLAPLVDFFKQLDDAPGGRALLRGLQYIEQPIPRSRSLDADAAPALAALSEIAPVILDEADHGIEAFPRALELGYKGISVKNCKGVFRALLNRGLCTRHAAFQSAEDLTNLGVLALQQDLATHAALGLTHVERNGHHYFRGLDHLPVREARAALQQHADLYSEHNGCISLRAEQGRLDVRSLQRTGYGYDCEIAWEERKPLKDWSFAVEHC